MWDSLHKLSTPGTDVSSVGKMARLYDVAPVRDMQRRGWLALTADPSELEFELKGSSERIPWTPTLFSRS